MQYIDTQTGAYPRSAHPLTIFFEPFDGDDRYMPVVPVAPPEHDAATHKALETEPVEEGGQWHQAWSIVPLTPQEIEAARMARVPASVTRRQAKQALAINGLLANVQLAIDAIPDATQKAMMQIEWYDSQAFERHRPSLIAICTALGLSSDGIDDLFLLAETL